jgi:polar amino acid transport system substrate-binding protein
MMNHATIIRVCIWLTVIGLVFTSAIANAKDEPQAITLISASVEGLIEDDRGPYFEFFQAAAEESGVKVKFWLMPWKRAIVKGESDAGYFVFPLTRTEEREPRYNWVARLRQQNSGFVAIGKKIDDIEAAAKLKYVTVWRGSVQHDFLVASGLENIQPINTNKALRRWFQFEDTAWFGALGHYTTTIPPEVSHSDLVAGEPLITQDWWLATAKNTETEKFAGFFRKIAELRDEGLLKRLLDEAAINDKP